MRDPNRERRAIEEAVLGFFTATGPERVDRSAGRLRAHLEATELVGPNGPVTTNKQLSGVDRLMITRLDESSATVQFSATQRDILTWPTELAANFDLSTFTRPQEIERHYSGPVELVYEHGDWKVADYTRDGLRACELLIDAAAPVLLGGTKLTLLGGWVSPTPAAVSLLVELDNRHFRTATIEAAAVVWRDADGTWKWTTAVACARTLPLGITRFCIQGWPRDPQPGMEVRPYVATDLGPAGSTPDELQRADRPGQAVPLLDLVGVGVYALLVGLLANAGGAVVVLLTWSLLNLQLFSRRRPRLLLVPALAAVLLAAGAARELTRTRFGDLNAVLGPIAVSVVLQLVILADQRFVHRTFWTRDRLLRASSATITFAAGLLYLGASH